MARIIVVGNEKGGSGKSTTCMHVATALSRMGKKVGALDLDLRQKSFGRYIENRRAYLAQAGLNLPTPDYRDLPEADPSSTDAERPGPAPDPRDRGDCMRRWISSSSTAPAAIPACRRWRIPWPIR